MSGFFITLEGGEGSGKSTQLMLLSRSFEAAGLPLIITREPGGTPGAEALRSLLLLADGHEWDARAETLMFYAARLEHVNKRIVPALAADQHVICDRFHDSTFVYQGVGKGIDPEFIARLHRLTLGDFTPNLTLLLDIDPATGIARTQQRQHNETRFEQMDISFHSKVREGFLARAKAAPERMQVIDASQPASDVHLAIVQVIGKRLHLAIEAVA